MAAYVRGLAGRQLTELASCVETRDLFLSALAGGVREDCVDRAWRDPNARLTPDRFPRDPVKRSFCHGPGQPARHSFS